MMRRRSDLPPTPPQPWAQLIPADSFYARLAQWRDVLIDDEDYTPLQRVAMRMGCMASWIDESVLRRPPSEDRGCHRARYAQGRGGPYLWGWDLDRQALRHQGSKGRVSRAC